MSVIWLGQCPRFSLREFATGHEKCLACLKKQVSLWLRKDSSLFYSCDERKLENAGLYKSSAKNLDNCIGESGKKSISWMPSPEETSKPKGEDCFRWDGKFLSREPRPSSVLRLVERRESDRVI